MHTPPKVKLFETAILASLTGEQRKSSIVAAKFEKSDLQKTSEIACFKPFQAKQKPPTDKILFINRW
jgi:hypothetical protein